jgi:hypothetical protein
MMTEVTHGRLWNETTDDLIIQEQPLETIPTARHVGAGSIPPLQSTALSGSLIQCRHTREYIASRFSMLQADYPGLM